MPNYRLGHPRALNNIWGQHATGSEDSTRSKQSLAVRMEVFCLESAQGHVGPYREAMAQLEERRVGPLILASNRFWMGRGTMMFAEMEDGRL